MTVNGEVQTNEEATVYVAELDLFVKVKELHKTLAVLSIGQFFEDYGLSHEWTGGPLPFLIQKSRRRQV